MKLSKRMLSVVLCLIMVLGTFAIGGDGVVDLLDALYVKASAETYGVFTYTINNGIVTITACDKSASGDLVIPDSIEGYPVKNIIGLLVTPFSNCAGISSITIPDSITYIAWKLPLGGLFQGCTGLESIMVSEGNTVYHSSGNCLIETESKTLIAGSNNSVIPNDGSVTSIGDYSFKGCSRLEGISIPDGVTSIGREAFSGCSGLININIPNSVTSIGDSAFRYCSGLTGINIPDSVTSMGNSAFYGCSGLTSATIGSGVTSIGGSAFFGCTSLESITIPETVTSIGGDAFCDCNELKSITIGNGVTNIGWHAFNNTAFYNDEKNWENGVLYLDNYLINAKNDLPKEYTITEGTQLIAGGAFAYFTGLKSITIPDSVTNIGLYAFERCTGLERITVSEGNTVYHSSGNCLIETDSKTLIAGSNNSVIPNDGSVTSIGEYSFEGCSRLEGISIPDGVTSIGREAFSGCSGLTNITIPNSVTNIDLYAFERCTGLERITVSEGNTVYHSSGNCLIETERKTLIAGSNNSVIPDDGTVINIGREAFFGCSGLKSIIIPDSVTSISDYAFSGCSGLESITVSEGNTVYHSSGNCLIETERKTLIAGCKNSVIPDDGSVTSIGPCAFLSCTGLERITIPDGVTSIGQEAFLNCTDLTSITIPVSVTSIDWWAFDYSAIQTVYYSGTAADRENILIKENDYLLNAEWISIYNLGEETYSFENYSDEDSPYGHCFGMAVTSSGYYTGNLDKSIINMDDNTSLYSLPDTALVRKPICYYLQIQGSAANSAERRAIVAGGSIDLHREKNISKDWNECINYVKNKKYDNIGVLNIGMYFLYGGGHAVNFLYYKNVGGQDRMYAYDNNYPEIETYYYMGSDGYVHQGPTDTFGPIIGMDLMDINTYFIYAPTFDASRYIYANKNEIVVEGAEYCYMKCSGDFSDYVMYEISEEVSEVTVMPLTDNAHFTYCNNTCAFGAVDEDTYGKLKVVSENEVGKAAIDSGNVEIKFDIKNAPASDINPASSSKLIVPSNTEVEYAATVTVKAKATDVPEGYFVAFYDGNTLLKKGSNTEVSYTFPGEFTGTKNITAKIIDDNGNVQKDGNGNDLSASFEVKAKSGFFVKLIAFFKRLFRLLPSVTVEPK